MYHYPLAPHHMGVEYVALLDHVEASTALAIPGISSGPVQLDVSLEPAGTAGWRVRSEFGFIGFLDAAEAAEFPGLEWLRTARVTPTTWATVEVLEGTIDAAVHLGLAVWQVPLNNLPTGAVLLRPGAGVVVGGDFQALDTGQFFAELHPLDDAVLVRAGSRDLGTAVVPDYVMAMAALAKERGVALCARAYAADGVLAVDVPADPADLVDDAAAGMPAIYGETDRLAALVARLAGAGTSGGDEVDWEFTTAAVDVADAVPQGTRSVEWHPRG